MVNDITPLSPQETQAGWAFCKTHQGVSFQFKRGILEKNKKEFDPNHCTKKESFSEMMRILPVTWVVRKYTNLLIWRIIKLPWRKPKEIQASLWSLNEVLMWHFPISAHPSSLLEEQGPGNFPSPNLCRGRLILACSDIRCLLSTWPLQTTQSQTSPQLRGAESSLNQLSFFHARKPWAKQLGQVLQHSQRTGF